MKFIKEMVPYIIVIIAVLLFKHFIGAPIKVNGMSMYKTLHDKDIMILDKIGYRTKKIKRFDIVVAKYSDEYIIKRVIALPGETITYKLGKLYINGKEVKDKYGYGKTYDVDEVKVGKNEYFLMGDNRENSQDSRYVGTFNIKDILGHATYTLFPFNRFGKKE